MLQVAVSQGAAPECCLMLPLQSNSSTICNNTPQHTPDVIAEVSIQMLKHTDGNKITLISFYQHSKLSGAFNAFKESYGSLAQCPLCFPSRFFFL